MPGGLRRLEIKMSIEMHEELKGLANGASVTQGTAAVMLLRLGITTYRAQVKAFKDKESREKVYEEDYQI
jgi:hypothetical protein